MPIQKVQLTHCGIQKPYHSLNGYRKIGQNIIREWNNEQQHYRKFLINGGQYIVGNNDVNPKKGKLYFWGEWEGNSVFSPISCVDERIMPNGLHEPFHSIIIRGGQNTDPYIFGEDFKYCICKQKGQLDNLLTNSLIIFGSVFPSLAKFYVDTVFVVKNNDSATSVYKSGAINYSKIYIEETLKQLHQYLRLPHVNSNCKLYHGKTWWDDKDYFSFVPCKLEFDGKGFERFYLDLNDTSFCLSTNPTGLSYLKSCSLTPQQLWRKIVDTAIDQGFKLGIRFDEPIISNVLDQLNEINT